MANKKNQQEVLDMNETLNKSEAFVIKHKKAIIIAAIALLAVIAGIFAYKAYTGPREEKASKATFGHETIQTIVGDNSAELAFGSQQPLDCTKKFGISEG